MFLLKDTTQWRRRGSNPLPLGLKSSTLPLRSLLFKIKETKTNKTVFWKHNLLFWKDAQGVLTMTQQPIDKNGYKN